MYKINGVVRLNPCPQQKQMQQAAIAGFINLHLSAITPEAISNFVETVEEENT